MGTDPLVRMLQDVCTQAAAQIGAERTKEQKGATPELSFDIESAGGSVRVRLSGSNLLPGEDAKARSKVRSLLKDSQFGDITVNHKVTKMRAAEQDAGEE